MVAGGLQGLAHEPQKDLQLVTPIEMAALPHLRRHRLFRHALRYLRVEPADPAAEQGVGDRLRRMVQAFDDRAAAVTGALQRNFLGELE